MDLSERLKPINGYMRYYYMKAISINIVLVVLILRVVFVNNLETVNRERDLIYHVDFF